MEIGKITLRKATLRLLPLLALCYLVAYLDRINVSFAALTMNADLGISSTAYGLGAGLFFVTYFAFEVPSNLIMERVGARVWIARIMISWGILSGMTAFIPNIAAATGFSNVAVFYTIRLLLGLAEAGFFPGVIFYLSLWFPAENRAKIVGYFMAAIPVSSVVGAPISGALLGMDGVAGLYGWQWMFLLEAAPAIILAFVVFAFLTDRPTTADWLAESEKAWLVATLKNEQDLVIRTTEHTRWSTALVDRRVIALSLVYFGFVVCLYGLGFFLPQIIKGFGISNFQTGLVTAIPYLLGAIAAVYWGRRSDARGERRFHCVCGLVVAAIGIAGSALFADPVLKIISLSVAAFGLFGGMPVFWSLPGLFLTGSAAAAGIAVINSIGNLAGFIAPFGIGYLKDRTGTFDLGLLVLAGCGAGAALLVGVTVKRPGGTRPLEGLA
jgi:MFS family permease